MRTAGKACAEETVCLGEAAPEKLKPIKESAAEVSIKARPGTLGTGLGRAEPFEETLLRLKGKVSKMLEDSCPNERFGAEGSLEDFAKSVLRSQPIGASAQPRTCIAEAGDENLLLQRRWRAKQSVDVTTAEATTSTLAASVPSPNSSQAAPSSWVKYGIPCPETVDSASQAAMAGNRHISSAWGPSTAAVAMTSKAKTATEEISPEEAKTRLRRLEVLLRLSEQRNMRLEVENKVLRANSQLARSPSPPGAGNGSNSATSHSSNNTYAERRMQRVQTQPTLQRQSLEGAPHTGGTGALGMSRVHSKASLPVAMKSTAANSSTERSASPPRLFAKSVQAADAGGSSRAQEGHAPRGSSRPGPSRGGTSRSPSRKREPASKVPSWAAQNLNPVLAGRHSGDTREDDDKVKPSVSSSLCKSLQKPGQKESTAGSINTCSPAAMTAHNFRSVQRIASPGSKPDPGKEAVSLHGSASSARLRGGLSSHSGYVFRTQKATEDQCPEKCHEIMTAAQIPTDGRGTAETSGPGHGRKNTISIGASSPRIAGGRQSRVHCSQASVAVSVSSSSLDFRSARSVSPPQQRRSIGARCSGKAWAAVAAAAEKAASLSHR